MAFDQKCERIASSITDSLNARLASAAVPVAAVKKYDANKDVYVEVSSAMGVEALVKVEPIPQIGNALANPVTGLNVSPFNPHRIKVGFDTGVRASGTITLSAVVAGNTVTVNGTGLVANTDFQVGASDAITAANLAAAINVSVAANLAGKVFAVANGAVVTVYASQPGPLGNAITLVATTAVRFVVSGATLSGGTSSSHPVMEGIEYAVIGECILRGPEVRFYAKANIAITDLTDANSEQYLTTTFANLEWSILNQQ